jgi:hypothetical protein
MLCDLNNNDLHVLYCLGWMKSSLFVPGLIEHDEWILKEKVNNRTSRLNNVSTLCIITVGSESAGSIKHRDMPGIKCVW